MKKLITLTVLLLTSQAFAISESDSWADIKAEVKADKKLSMDFRSTFVGQNVSVFDVCIDGENFETTRVFPIYKYVKVPRHMDSNDGERDGRAQQIVGYDYLSYPINSTRTVTKCRHNDKDCRRVEIPFNQDTEKMISIKKYVRSVGSSDRSNRKVYKTLFKKEYVIPTCN